MGPYFEGMDLVITEGFKNDNRPKIEVFRQEIHSAPLFNGNSNFIAMVTDAEIDLDIPRLKMDEINALADLIETTFL